MYKVLSSSSKGNCIIYLDAIAIDMGVSYKIIEPHKNALKLVLLSHIHSDHFCLSTIKKLAIERPMLRFAAGPFLKEHLQGIKNVDILEHGNVYDYGEFKISPIKLFHNVENYGFRIFKGETKIIHCTDTAHLEGIEAKDYSLYAIESNHCEEFIDKRIEQKQKRGEFAYEIGARNSHLSEQQARDFIFKNRGPNSQVLRLHESANN
jgi:hypothetical protein